MACTCVPHIVLHVSCRTRTSGGYFRPSEVRFRGILPLSSDWFYNVKTQKRFFSKIAHQKWLKLKISTVLYAPSPYPARGKMRFPQHLRRSSNGVCQSVKKSLTICCWDLFALTLAYEDVWIVAEYFMERLSMLLMPEQKKARLLMQALSTL